MGRQDGRPVLPLLLIYALLLMLAGTWCGHAVAAANYTRHVWHVADGLPEDTIQALAQTADGYLLVGTTGGLARFDGSHFHLYGQTPTLPLGDASIFCALQARDGSTWLGTEGSGLIHLGAHGSRLYASADGLNDLFVRALLEDHAGRIWVGTDKGLFRLQANHIESVDTSALVPALAVHSIMEDRAHRIWVGGSQLLVFEPSDQAPGEAGGERVGQGGVQGGRVHLLHLPGRDSLARIKALLQTADGTVWAGTVNGLDRMTDGHFSPVSQIAGTVRSLYQTSDGILWIGTIGHGLWQYSKGVFSNFDSSGLLPSRTVLCVFEDASQQVWAGTQEGLVRLNKTPVSLLPLPGGSDPDFATISADTDGTIWAAFSRVFAIRNGTARRYRFPQIPDVPIRTIFRAHDRSLWIGTDGDGVYHLMGHAARHFAAPASLTNNFVRAIVQDRDGAIWLGLDDGLSQIRTDGSVRNYGMQDGLAYFSTRALVEDSHGDLWVGTEKGVSHMHAGKFVSDGATQSLAREKVWSILEDSTGVMWFGTRNHGLFRYVQGRMIQYTTAQGLIGNSIYQLLEEGGSLWMSGPNAISSLRLSQIREPASVGQLAIESWELPYDAAGALLYGGRQPSGCIGADRSIWFPSSKGALRILPRPEVDVAPPRAILLSVAVDGRVMPPASQIVLPASAGRLEIGFTPLMLRSQQGLRFRYKLNGFDRTWNYAGVDRIASYTNLPAGQYTFSVQAFELSHPDVFTETVLSLGKNPYFYETWWFAVLAVSAVLLLIWIIYRSRVRVLRLRFKAVIEERGRIAREMHDTIIQGCTSVSALLEGLSSLSHQSSPLEQELIEHARIQVRTTVQEAREAVWDLRHKDDSMPDLYHAIATLADNAAREAGIVVQCRKEGRSFTIPGPPARELLMVVREAIYNAALHGRPQRIDVAVAFTRAAVTVSVNDDGAGFMPALQQADRLHYGLAGMRERIERMGGELVITSRPSQGTLVRFMVQRSQLQSMANNRAETL